MAATFYEALSGTRAFPGEDAVAVAARITTDEVSGIALACGLDPHVDGVLLRALSKEPAQRFPSARHLGEALAEALERRTRASQATLPDQYRKHVPGDDGRGLRTLFGGIALGVLLGAAGLQLTSGLREHNTEAAPVVKATSTRAVAYLAEAPRHPRPRPSAVRRTSSAEHTSARSVPSASAKPQPAASDAGAPLPEPSAQAREASHGP